jgi:hypothetical protein
MAYKIEKNRSWTDEYLVEEYLMCRQTHQSWTEVPDYEGRDADLANMEENLRNIQIELSRRRMPIPPFR